MAAPTSLGIQRAIDGTLLICLAALAILVAAGSHGPPRVILAFVFAMVAPGWVVTGYWGSLPLYSRLIVSTGSSIGICIAATSIALWLRLWHPTWIFVILAVLVGLALLWRFWSPSAPVDGHDPGEVGAAVE
jgi:uncharacterized membrane protein